MDWSNIINQLFEVCLIPMLGMLTAYAVKLIKSKMEEARSKTDSALADKYLSMLETTVIDCIKATNQTYVNALKEKDAFDANAQKEALTRTTGAVFTVLSDEAKECLRSAVGDLEVLVNEKIEANISSVK
jgi:hypothetical protein